MDSSAPQLPAWVQKRDGSTVPFEADKLHRALFAATDALGSADAFIAQELADGVLHFLADESDGSTVTSAQIEETLLKVVRELGQTAIAQKMVDHRKQREKIGLDRRPSSENPAPGPLGPTGRHLHSWIANGISPVALQHRCAGRVLEQFSLEEVYSPNLAAAHREGLLILSGLETPLSLSALAARGAMVESTGTAVSLNRARSLGVFEIVEKARQNVGQVIALDSPERELAGRGLRVAETAAYVRELDLAARTAGLQVVLNLGCESAPEWEKEWAPGPLFSDARPAEMPERIVGHLDALLEQILQGSGALAIHWHMADRDFADEAGRRRLTRIARAAIHGSPITFVCDRPSQPVSLAEGLDRRHPAILLSIGLHLPFLCQRLGGKPTGDAFLRKLDSLTRMAVAAGMQKREFLRRNGGQDRPLFMLDNGRVHIHLIGVDSLLRSLFNDEPAHAEKPQSFALQMISHLQETLANETKNTHLSAVLDDSPGVLYEEPRTADLKTLLTAAGTLHETCGRGTFSLPYGLEQRAEPAGLVELLHFAMKQTAVHRIRLVSSIGPQRQLSVYG